MQQAAREIAVEFDSISFAAGHGLHGAAASCKRLQCRGQGPYCRGAHMCRYSAYVEHAIDYKSTRDWSEQSTWLGLKVVAVEKGGLADSEGIVEFEAAYERNGLKDVHRERAKFKKDNGRWLYDEGHVTPLTIVRTGPKTGKNDPCPCGSVKKFKHCCGR